MSFLSGLPESARKRRLILSFQVFVDDSGGKGQGGALVLGGMIASAEEWATFSDEWRAALAEEPAISCFKMREAACLGGEFRGLLPARRDAKLQLLARIINRLCRAAIFVSVDLAGYSESVSPHTVKPLSEPYFFPFYCLILGACDHLWDEGVRSGVEFIFDDNAILAPRLSRWYPMVREVARRKNPERFPLLPPNPIFKDDKEFLPLQAADLYAWNCRKFFSGETNQFDWLTKHLSDVRISEYSQNLTAGVMGDIRERANAVGLTEEELEAYRDLVSP